MAGLGCRAEAIKPFTDSLDSFNSPERAKGAALDKADPYGASWRPYDQSR